MKMGCPYLLCCSFFLLTISLNIAYSSSPGPRCHPEEGAALFQFLNTLEEKQECRPMADPIWNRSVDCCSWDGVECDMVTGRVIGVSLMSYCLRGIALSSRSTIFELRSLQTLSLWGIQFQRSSLPKEIGTLLNLRGIQMTDSGLTGSIPADICNLKKLQTLSMDSNRFTGVLPKCIFDLPDLRNLGLHGNLLTGSLPPTISGLSNLGSFDLSSNMLSGSVPSWLFTIPSLSYIGIHSNNFSGALPPFPKPYVTSLTRLDLNNNNIQGSIPLSFFELINLTNVNLNDNQLSGIIKWSMFKRMVNVEYMSLYENKGLSLKNDENSANVLPKLLWLDLALCNLTEFPVMGNQSLRLLNVSHNRIDGRILTGPYLAGGWEKLQLIDASHNLITGFDNYPSLTVVFDLSFNRLMGTLKLPPPTISVLALGNNQLTGEIPTDFCQLSHLAFLDLSFNHLTGVVPPCLGNVTGGHMDLLLEGNDFNCSNTSKIC